MKRKEFGKLLNLKSQLVPKNNGNRPGTKNTGQFITIHNTDNTSAGADAAAHSRFVRRKHTAVSWHYTVDDKEAIKQIPIGEKAFHAKSNGNRRSIGIEICMHQGIDQQNAFLRAARLVAVLLFDTGKSIDSVVPHHHWTGKNCPRLLLSNGKPGNRWKQFKRLVSDELASIDP